MKQGPLARIRTIVGDAELAVGLGGRNCNLDYAGGASETGEVPVRP